MTKFIFSTIILLSFVSNYAQTKSPVTVAFYNCENFFDTKDDPNKKDDEFLPDSPMKWDETRYTNWILRLKARDYQH
jgi:hypothetical protein